MHTVYRRSTTHHGRPTPSWKPVKKPRRRRPFNLGRRKMSVKTIAELKNADDWRVGYLNKTFIFWSRESKYHPDFGELNNQVTGRLDTPFRLASFGVLVAVILIILAGYLHYLHDRMAEKRRQRNCRCLKCRIQQQQMIEREVIKKMTLEQKPAVMSVFNFNRSSMMGLHEVKNLMAMTTIAGASSESPKERKLECAAKTEQEMSRIFTRLPRRKDLLSKINRFTM